MVRRKFGGGLDAWTLALGDAATSQSGLAGNVTLAIPTVAVTFWDAATAGTQYLDLMDQTNTAVSTITSDSAGEIPEFWGPDTHPDTWGMWADANGGNGPRRLILATDVGGAVSANQARLENVENTVAALTALAAVSVVTVTYDEVAGTWPVRPVIAGSRVVFWFGPAASPPPTGYMQQNDQFFGWQG